MPMKNPPHPGQHIRSELDHLGKSVAEAAEALDVTRQQLHNVVTGRSGITPEMAVRLAAGIGGTADGWIGLQRAYDVAQVQKRAAEITARVRRLVPA